ncbi:MAG TPA: methionyl-tRNA formyltransferase [Candidatus Lumbricidophila sp.]|nr:methionyl-tRNA formyltransferase [Candidatus Lumbricidophila sp.]
MGVGPVGQNGQVSGLGIVFAGTPAVAVPSLELLVAAGHDVRQVITRPDAPLGRKRILTPSPVAEAATRVGIDVVKAARLGDEVSTAVATAQPDLGVVVAYGGLVREPLLSMPRLGWINLHFSLLPAWRGAAPVQWSLIRGDTEVGAAVFQLVPELDAGAVFATMREPNDGVATAGDLLERFSHSGAQLLRSVVDQLADGTAVATPQPIAGVSLAPKLSRDDGCLVWTRDHAEVLNRFRGVTPEPGAWTTLQGSVVKVLAAAASDADLRLAPGELLGERARVLVGTAGHPIELRTVQPAGKSAMSAADWARGLGGQPLRFDAGEHHNQGADRHGVN